MSNSRICSDQRCTSGCVNPSVRFDWVSRRLAVGRVDSITKMRKRLRIYWPINYLSPLFITHYVLLFCCSMAKSCPILCDPTDCSTLCFTVLHYLPEFAQFVFMGHSQRSRCFSGILLFFSMIQWMVAMVPLPFPNPASTSVSSRFRNAEA